MNTLPKLETPIDTTIEIVIYSWRDRTYGNPYASARVYINGSSEAFKAYGLQYNDARNMEYEVIQDLKKSGLLPDVGRHYYPREYKEHGILITVSNAEVKKVIARQHGVL